MTAAVSGRLDDRIALITGASRGIGAAVAKRFAAEGAHVILVARSVDGLEAVDDAIQAAGGTATLVPTDLSDWPTIDRLAHPILERWGRLDVLVGNAAMLGPLSPVGHIAPDHWENAFKLNVHANWRLIRALDPLLRASPAGRAIFVTSGITRNLHPFWGAYAASKAALEALVLTYAAEVAQTNLRVNLINPGPIRTEMRASAFPGEDPMSLPAPDEITKAFVALAEKSFDGHGLWLAADHWPPAGVTAH